MRFSGLALLVTFGCSAGFSAAQADPGARAYEEGAMERALDHYRDALDDAGDAMVSDLWFNAGTAAAQLGMHAEARYYLLQARALAPRDAAVHHNLEHVERALDLPTARGVVPQLRGWLDAWTSGELWWAALLLQSVGLVAAACTAPRTPLRRLAWCALAAGVLSAVAVTVRRFEPMAAIVLDGGAVLRRAPHTDLPTVGRLPAGARVVVEQRSDRWAHVRSEDVSGWLPAPDVGVLLRP